MNRIGLKLICLLVSLVLWIQVASTTIVAEKVNLPLEVRGLKSGLTLAGNSLPSSVRVQLRGSKLRLIMHRFFGADVGTVILDVSREPVGTPVQREVGIADVESDLAVLAVTPPLDVRLTVDRLTVKRLSVRVATEGEPPEGKALLGPPRVDPQVATASGPARLLADLEGLSTEPIDLGRSRSTVELTAPLEAPSPGVSLDPSSVRVIIVVVPRQTRTFTNVPVSVVGGGSRIAVAVFPPMATVVISGPEDSLRTLGAGRVAVKVGLAGLGPGVYRLRGRIDLPGTYQVQSIAPEEFVVRIGRPERGDG
jgi:YbbR domain-containing protein